MGKNARGSLGRGKEGTSISFLPLSLPLFPLFWLSPHFLCRQNIDNPFLCLSLLLNPTETLATQAKALQIKFTGAYFVMACFICRLSVMHQPEHIIAVTCSMESSWCLEECFLTLIHNLMAAVMNFTSLTLRQRIGTNPSQVGLHPTPNQGILTYCSTK